MKIDVTFVYPPIPLRQFDWRATLDGYEPGDPMGEGVNARDAVNDLFTSIEDSKCTCDAATWDGHHVKDCAYRKFIYSE